MPEVLATTTAEALGVAAQRAAERWRAGELVAFPTETVYGLGAAARSAEAVAKVFAAKGRPSDHPLIVHLPEVALMPDWGEPNEAAWALARRYWPGPLTLVLRRAPHVLDAVTGGQPTVALRVPDHPVALALLRGFGDGVAAPSANRFGRISPTCAEHVATDYAADASLLIVDGGPCGVGVESTIVDCSGPAARVLRLGGVALDDLAATLGVAVASLRSAATPVGFAPESPRVPGALERHYAPRTPTRLTAAGVEHGHEVAVLALRERPRGHRGPWVQLPNDPQRAAARLYAALRELDAAGASAIELEAPPPEAPWAVIDDRLRRAAAPQKELL